MGPLFLLVALRSVKREMRRALCDRDNWVDQTAQPVPSGMAVTLSGCAFCEALQPMRLAKRLSEC
jgi:hypothetical protein